MSFLEIFNPGLRHMREERQRRQNARESPAFGAGGSLGIDLDAGTAIIRLPAAPPEPLVTGGVNDADPGRTDSTDRTDRTEPTDRTDRTDTDRTDTDRTEPTRPRATDPAGDPEAR